MWKENRLIFWGRPDSKRSTATSTRKLSAGFELLESRQLLSIVPVDLQCMARQNPLGIDDLHPTLSWQLDSTVAGQRGESQTAYQILVASSPAILANNQGDLWNTGKVNTGQTTQIAYSGTALASQKICYWKVRTWDAAGQPSEWSSSANWSMGLLNTSDWTAQWIGRDDGPDLNGASLFTSSNWIWYPEGNPASSAPVATRYFRKTFTAPAGATVTQATVYMTADDQFTFYVNGQSALSGTNWGQAYSADITSLMTGGTNVFAVAATNGGTAPNAAGLIGRISVTLSNGLKYTILTDGTWLAANQLYANWDLPGYTPSGWPSAMVLGNYGMSPWGTFTKDYVASTYLRKDFTLSQVPTRAVLYVTAEGLVEPHLNGSKVGNDDFVPGWSNYNDSIYYTTYDVTSSLHAGVNTLGAILGDGWFRGNVAWSGQNKYGSNIRLREQLQLYYDNGSSQTIASDSSWKAAFGPIRSSDILAGETYDARLEMPGWDNSGFNASSWLAVTSGSALASGATPVMKAYPADPVRAEIEITPIAITQPQTGVYVVNMGQNFAGWARLHIDAPAGTVITMQFAERLNADGTVYRDNYRSAAATDTYICKGGGETWEPHFTYRGYQYIQVTGLPSPPTLATFTGIAAYSDNAAASAFQSSSALVNQIFQNTVWGQRSNYFEVPTDCPQRDERQGWTGDAASFVHTGAYNMDVDAFFSKWMNEVRDSQMASGAFANISPSVADPTGWSPAWGDAGIIVPWTMYLMYGDKQILADNYTAMAKYLAFYQSQSSGFIGPNAGFGDWLAPDGNTALNLISTAFFAHCSDLMSQIAGALGKTTDAANYRTLFTNISTAFQSEFINADGTIGGNSQTGYLLALGYNLLTPAQRVTAGSDLVTAIQKAGWHLTTGFLGTALLLPVLNDIGRADIAYSLIQNATYPSWGYMVEEGATTIWERWDGYTEANGFQDPGMNSFNHYALGACSQWLMQSMLGIDTQDNGFQQIVVKPQLGSGIDWAAGYYDSVHGRISSSWVVTGGNRLDLNVSIPVNTTATIYVPTTNASSVTESGTPAAQAAGLTFLRYENGFAVYAAVSGDYSFAAVCAIAPSPLPVAPMPAAVVHLTFNVNTSNSGTAGAAANGTIAGTGTSYVAGKFGLSLNLTGSQTVNIPYSSALSLNTYTVSAWVNLSSKSGTQGIFSTRFGDEYTFDLKVNSDSIHGDIGNGSNWLNTAADVSAAQGGNISANEWHMITYVVSGLGDNVRMYIDGQYKASDLFVGLPMLMKSGQTLKIGNSYSGEYLTGKLDELWLFNSALSNAQVNSLYLYNNTAPTDILLSNSAVAENMPAGTTIGTLSSIDPAGNETFTYSLASGSGSTDNNLFTISGGTLRTAAAFDFEAKKTYSIRIRTTDSGNGNLTFEKIFTISVIDVPEAISIAASDWTAAGLTLKIGADGLLHVYMTGTVTDAVPPHNPANVTSVNIVGRDNADDELTVDFASGNPVPAGGVAYDGGAGSSGNLLLIVGTSGTDTVTVTAAQISVSGSAPISYLRTAYFGFDLGQGNNSLTIDHAAVALNRENAISAGTNVTLIGGMLNFNGYADDLGNLTLTENGQVGAAALRSSTTTVVSGTITAVSIVCDTLIIGSGAGALAVAKNAEVSRIDPPVEELVTGSPFGSKMLEAGRGSMDTIAPRAFTFPAAYHAKPADLPEDENNSIRPIYRPRHVDISSSVATDDLQASSGNRTPNTMLFVSELVASLAPAITLDSRFALGIARTVHLNERQKDAFFGRLNDFSAGELDQPSTVAFQSQDARSLAVQSVVGENPRESLAGQIDFDLIYAMQLQKQDKSCMGSFLDSPTSLLPSSKSESRLHDAAIEADFRDAFSMDMTFAADFR